MTFIQKLRQCIQVLRSTSPRTQIDMKTFHFSFERTEDIRNDLRALIQSVGREDATVLIEFFLLEVEPDERERLEEALEDLKMERALQEVHGQLGWTSVSSEKTNEKG